MGAKKLPIRGGFPEPPSHLKQHGKESWDLGIELWADCLLQKRDLANWILFAEAHDEKAQCEKEIAEMGRYQMTSNGCFVAHPGTKLKYQAENVIRKYSQMYGLVPNARQKRPPTNRSQGVTQRAR